MKVDTRLAEMLVIRTFIVDHGRVLVLQRAATDRNNPFLWEVPGGKCESGQEPLETLERETKEETGLEIRPVGLNVHSEKDTLQGGRYDNVVRHTFFGISAVTGGRIRLSHEHDEFRWCRYRDLLRLDLTEATRRAAYALKEPILQAGAMR